MAQSFPEIVASMEDLPNISLDGELVVLNDLGVPQFERLRWRSLMRQHKEVHHASIKDPAAIFAFDLLSLNGKDMRRNPLLERKEVLREEIADAPRIKYATSGNAGKRSTPRLISSKSRASLQNEQTRPTTRAGRRIG